MKESVRGERDECERLEEEIRRIMKEKRPKDFSGLGEYSRKKPAGDEEITIEVNLLGRMSGNLLGRGPTRLVALKSLLKAVRRAHGIKEAN